MAKLYATADLMQEVGVTPQQISHDVRQGNFRAERVGRAYVFTQEQYDAAVEYYRARRAEREKGGPSDGS